MVHIYACGQNTHTHRIIKEAHFKILLAVSFQNNLLGCKAMCFVCTSSHLCGIQQRIPLPKEIRLQINVVYGKGFRYYL